MIGGFGRMSTTGGFGGNVTGRFMGPTQYQAAQANLKKKETALATAKTQLKDHKELMKRARFTPDGFKKATAKLHALEKKVSTLTKEVKEAKRLMTVA